MCIGLKGAGGICDGAGFYHFVYPEYVQEFNLSISSLECLNLLIAVRVWIKEWSGMHVLIYCDNMATVAASNSARVEDPIIQGALRELWWLAAIHDVQIMVRHKPGELMTIPDMLSRAGFSNSHKAMLERFVIETTETRLLVPIEALLPPIDI